MSIVEVVRKSVTTVEVAHPGVQGPPGSGGGGGAVDSVNGRTGTVVLTSADVGLANVNNTSDASKPVSTAQAAADTAVATAASNALAAHVAAADPHTGYALESSLAAVATSGAYADLTGKPTLGTAAPLNVAASGDAASGEVVKGSDSRLTDARTPTTHTHTASQISDSTAAGRAVLTAADAAAQRTALGVPAGSGNSTGTNTGDQTNITGNAGTATALQTARNINGVAFDGTANITVNAVDSTARVAKAGDTLTGALNWSATQTIASATTTDIGAATSNSVIVSGTTTITALGTIAAGAERVVQFSGALTLTHNATSLILPGGASITTAAGDVAYFVSLGSGNWRCTGYQKANGQAVVSSGGISGLTAARVPFASNSTTLVDDAGLTYDSTNKAIAVGGATVTTSNPALVVNQTVNAGAVAFVVAKINMTNTASAAGTVLLEGQVGGTAKASIRKDGAYVIDKGSGAETALAKFSYGGHPAMGYCRDVETTPRVLFWVSGVNVGRDAIYAFTSSAANATGGTIDAAISRDASGRIGVLKSSGLGDYGDLKLRSLISTGTITLGNYTVATLPTAASNTHAIVAVTDGNASPTYRGAVTGGGSTKGVVYCDGSSWMWH